MTGEGKVSIYNLPTNATGFCVARLDENKLWCWGVFPTKEEADVVAKGLENSIVIEV